MCTRKKPTTKGVSAEIASCAYFNHSGSLAMDRFSAQRLIARYTLLRAKAHLLADGLLVFKSRISERIGGCALLHFLVGINAPELFLHDPAAESPADDAAPRPCATLHTGNHP